MSDKEIRPYGLWPSPITPAMMARRLRLDDVQWDSDGRTLVWLEGRSDQGVLVCRRDEGAIRDLTDELSVRAGVGYGGGDFAVGHGFVVFAERNGRLYRQPLAHGSPRPITPAFGHAASPVISPDGRWVLFVHSYERVDVLGLVDSLGQQWPIKLVAGSDFYMQPVWHPVGDRIAWVEWDHPNMPWDGTRLKLAWLAGEPPRVVEETLIAGGIDVPVFQPAFSPDGRWLSFIATEGEWDRLYLLDLTSGERRVLIQDAVLALPAWVQGLRTYGWSHDSRCIFYQRNDRGFGSLWAVGINGEEPKLLNTTPYTWHAQIAPSPKADRIAFIGSASTVPTRVVVWEAGQAHVQRHSLSETVAAEDLPTPRPIEWKAPDGTTVHGLYYPPTSSRFVGTGLPPGIVSVHGGPTGQRVASYSADAAFFTSRGYGFLEVNYRGSTGYGRSYMLALREHWGMYDVEDAVGGARALGEQGLADPSRLAIMGGSAGGYTVLNALIRHPGVFKAGICLFGVTNLFTLATDTHKFEERYLDSMVGPLPQAAERYRNWSPLFHADQIRDPVAIFQGKEDKVVPPDQAESIVQVLRARGTPHIYRLYEGEGHGWRKAETIVSYYADVERFLRQHLLFA
ncbi:MAG: S9 family peptidase [Anaerolineae bacterium]|nr:S9 family peptidase [Anaerolineae bacterium]MDW8098505.1 S9 family peptidase [Anaerolineae bacterium]